MSLLLSQHNDVVSPSLMLIVFIFLFPHFPWVWPLIPIAAYIRTTLLIEYIVAIYPPLEAWFWTRPLQCQWLHWWQLILQRHRTYTPSSCRWRPTRQNLSRIIIWRRRADSARRWEQPRDLASTSLWPSTARLSSTPQPLCDRGISPIDSSGRNKVLVVEGNSLSAAVFVGQ